MIGVARSCTALFNRVLLMDDLARPVTSAEPGIVLLKSLQAATNDKPKNPWIEFVLYMSLFYYSAVSHHKRVKTSVL